MDGPQVSQHAMLSRSESSEMRDRADSLDTSTWEAADGIDKLMVSVSKSNTPVGSTTPVATTTTPPPAPETVFRPTPSQTQNPLRALEAPTEPEKMKLEPQGPTGTLKVNLDDAATADGAAKPAKSFGAKKPVTKKKIGAKKLGVENSTELRMESFEKVEKRSQKAAQEAADFDTAVALDKSEYNASYSSVSRVSAAYDESNAPTVTVASKQVQKGSIYTQDPSSVNKAGSVSSSLSGGRFSPPVYAATDSRFANKKGFGSDAYFGRDKEDEAEMRGKLNKYGNATAISSDMLYHDKAAPDFGTVSYADTMAQRARAGSGELGKLKESVKNFFEDVSRNIG